MDAGVTSLGERFEEQEEVTLHLNKVFLYQGLLVKGLACQSALKLEFLKYFFGQIFGLSSFPLHPGYFNPDQFPEPVQCAAARSAALAQLNKQLRSSGSRGR